MTLGSSSQSKEPRIIYEDDNFLAVDKPAGLLVHKAKNSGDEPTLVDWLLARYPEIKNVGDNTEQRPGIVHRLDKDTSGIMLIPKNQFYFEYLKHLFQTKEVKKTYIAIVHGIPKEKKGIITKSIGIKDGTLKRSVYSIRMAKEAVTEWKLLKTWEREGEDFSLLEIIPKTGRTHQIRVHLASLGHPIVGDSLYGFKRHKKMNLVSRQLLHAESIEFSIRSGKRVTFSADMPREFEEFLKTHMLQ